MADRSISRHRGRRRAWLTHGLVCVLGFTAPILQGCDEPPKDAKLTKPGASSKEVKLEPVTIAGKEFKLEPALDDQTRFKGLSGREEVKPDGGMLFVFTRAEHRYFVMRDCPISIDIIFLDAAGRVTAFHKMLPEDPRSEEEKKLSAPYPGAPASEYTNAKYEARLKRYDSKYSAQFVIELKGGTLDSLNLKEGDQVKLDVAGLKKRAS